MRVQRVGLLYAERSNGPDQLRVILVPGNKVLQTSPQGCAGRKVQFGVSAADIRIRGYHVSRLRRHQLFGRLRS